jgi:molecular chaperone DnaK
VHVTAKDLGTGKEQSIKITATQKLSEDEIQRMRKEAEEHAEDDKKRKEEIEIINQADSLVYSSEKLFEDFKGKVNDSKLDDVKKDIDEIKQLLTQEKKDVSEIKKKTDAVNNKIQELSIAMYQKVAEEQAKQKGAAGAGQGPEETTEEPAGEASSEENVVDAEFTEKDEKSKAKKKK